ncbi:MAG: hypothetical protein H0U49_12395 [Parachlamydiaceae bacterium]|nr:hypothetical protein [Parachlamydiaceae bacterium]
MPAYSATPKHQVVYIIQEADENESEGLIVTDIGLVGFIVDEWGDNSLGLVPNKGDVLEIFQEEDDDIWGFRHNQSGDLIYIYEIGFSDLKHHRIKKFNLEEEIVQLDDGTFYQIMYDGDDEDFEETTEWKQGQSVWIVTCRWNDSLQFLLNIDTQELREVKPINRSLRKGKRGPA